LIATCCNITGRDETRERERKRERERERERVEIHRNFNFLISGGTYLEGSWRDKQT
jgi:hypothetical protein